MEEEEESEKVENNSLGRILNVVILLNLTSILFLAFVIIF